MIYFGIDPGQKTGYALWDSKSKSFLEIGSGDFWEVVDKLEEFHNTHFAGLHVVIENPNLNKTTHGRDHFKNYATLDRKAQSVGMNKRDAQLLLGFCLRKQIGYSQAKPTKATAKKDQEQFRKITGWKHRTNQHERDAAMLVFGR